MRAGNLKIWLLVAIGALALLLAISHLRFTNQRLENDLGNKEMLLDALVVDANILRNRLSANNAIDIENNKKLRDAYDEIENLRDRVSSGVERVYVNAVCPASVQSPSEPASMADGARVELDRDAQQDYLRLRRELEEDRVKIQGLQRYVLEVCLNGA